MDGSGARGDLSGGCGVGHRDMVLVAATAHWATPGLRIWLLVLMGLPHAGLDEDVLDHRLNSRTVIMNPVLRFVYMNMNYHIEHHVPHGAVLRPATATRGDKA